MNQSFQSFGEENVGKFTIANISYFSNLEFGSKFCPAKILHYKVYDFSRVGRLQYISWIITVCRSIAVITPYTYAKGKAIVLYICQHKNHHFGKSRHLSDLLACLFSLSLQKTSFSPLQIVWYSSRES